ncbi:MAG TPA: FG-GAP-like repeat-containing protein [Pyrinomonadaceae bacterium]|jgi:cytochrome c-type biogenesis protein CcmH/NrfG|nr:FG-GAP-like repeat-containing protein [Pyrinomonadaceae bacterium]
MKFHFRLFAFTAAMAAALGLSVSSSSWQGLTDVAAHPQTSAAAPAASREDAYRANNLGVALLEQYKYKEGAEAFARALELDPKLAMARINLSIALFNVPDLRGAQREAEAAAALAPDAPQPLYIMGLVARSQNRADDAINAFQRVLRIDPRDVGANVNLGQLLAQQRKYAEAVAAFRTAMAVEPYNLTAIYNLATALTRTGEREEGARMVQKFQALRQSGAGSTIGQNYLEQGRYAEAVASTGAEAGLVDRATPAVVFNDATATLLPSPAAAAKAAGATLAASWPVGRQFKGGELTDATRREIARGLGGAVTPFDLDGDGDLDLFVATATEQRLYLNDGGKFSDVTGQSGALGAATTTPSGATPTGAVAGDYDNDTRPDLFVLRDTSLSLYHNDGGGKFSDVTRAAALPSYPYLSVATAFVDVDHDGDLDIFIAGLADLSKAAQGEARFPLDFAGAPNMLLRNDGTGKFTDITATAKVGGAPGHAVAVVPTDYDNRRDVDLVVVNYGKAAELFSNQRDGSFRELASEVGLSAQGDWTSAAAGDLNKDGFTDLFFGRADGPGMFAMSDGQGRFKTRPAPAGTEAALAAQFLDYDDDGLLDCVMLSSAGSLRVWRNVGDGWVDVTESAAARGLFVAAASSDASQGSAASGGRAFASGDLDGDGDTDLIALASNGEARVARNDGGNRNASVRVRLTGKVSNRSGVGAKIEARAGSLIQKLETYAASPAPAPADVVFGLGKRAAPDAVRVLWPAGIVQAETQIASSAPDPKKQASAVVLPIIELDRKPSSCPYLYTWNGERFEFITDFMGGGEMGYWEAPGLFNTPDPDEYVRIRGDQLRERDGRYELRVTNELEEALFIDRLQLISIAHPREVEVYPNEGMKGAPLPPFRLYKTRGARPPLAATDDHGHDVLPRISRLDRQFPDDFPLDTVRGYAGEHALVMKLDEEKGSAKGRTLLLLTGWTDYSWSSDNVAASQGGKGMRAPSLQVKDARGRWRTVIENIGVPIGRPQTVAVELTGKFLSPSREVRILTNMRIYWDQVLVDTSSGDFPSRLTRLDATRADLRWRGFSREVTPDGREPFGYDYERVSYTSPWKVMPGRYTREGDVSELLQNTDDIFVISRPGDELLLSFDASKLAPLPRGWTRTFLLYADGFSKEMDINSAAPNQVAPLPFHGMKGYPYAAPEAYPMTARRRALYEKYNTRVVAREVPAIETTYAEALIFGATSRRNASDKAEGGR